MRTVTYVYKNRYKKELTEKLKTENSDKKHGKNKLICQTRSAYRRTASQRVINNYIGLNRSLKSTCFLYAELQQLLKSAEISSDQDHTTMMTIRYTITPSRDTRRFFCPLPFSRSVWFHVFFVRTTSQPHQQQQGVATQRFGLAEANWRCRHCAQLHDDTGLGIGDIFSLKQEAQDTHIYQKAKFKQLKK